MNNIIKKIVNNTFLSNIIILFTGQSIGSLIGLLNTVLLVNKIGIYGNGILTLIISYTSLFDGIFNFQSFNAIIKFGTDALAKQDKEQYKKYIKQAIILDVVTAIFAFIVGWICIPLFINYMKWDNNYIPFLKIYLFTTLFNINGCSTGILRLHNKFNKIARVNIYSSAIKLFFICLIFNLDIGLVYFVILEACIIILSNLYLIICTIKVLKENNLIDFWFVKDYFSKEFFIFNLYNNLTSTLDLPVGQLLNFIINKILGVEALGIYAVLLKIGGIITKITNPVTQSLLPEIALKVSEKNISGAKELCKKVFKYTMLIGSVILIFLIFLSRYWFTYLLDYSYDNLLIFSMYTLFVIFAGAISGVHLLFISLNLVKYNIPIILITNFVYIICTIYLGINLGLIGIIISLFIQSIFIIVIKLLIIRFYNLS